MYRARTVAASGSSRRDIPAENDPARIALIGYQDQGNLGMGYLAAVLQREGYQVDLLDVRLGGEKIARTLQEAKPIVVGFSLIFQFFLPQFRALAQHLREAGIDCHFTIGGHYPSLCHEELLSNFPEVDSVVRYEGEETLVELVACLTSGGDWRQLHGIAFGQDGEVVETQARALVQDLDSLPFPSRPYAPEHIAGFPTLPVLASRGCIRRCSFCSIHTFYRTAPGRVVRVRKPEKVIEEMLELRHRFGVRVFLFQDDDFPLWGKKGRRWGEEMIDRMHQSGLSRDCIWKISCRAEYVEPDMFRAMRDAGLFLVYMGIESGVEEGLEVLFKQTSVEDNLNAVACLKELGLVFSYGFMLFDPSSTFASIRGNIAFLRKIVGDGTAPAVFSRMLPYGGTPIRDQLAKEGRLRGDLTHPDYDFLDLRINEFHARLTRAVRPWIHKEGLAYQISYAWDELETIERLVPGTTGGDAYRKRLRALTEESNERLFRLVEEASLAFEDGDDSVLRDVADIHAYCRKGQKALADMRNIFVAENLDPIALQINADCASGPVLMPQVH